LTTLRIKIVTLEVTLLRKLHWLPVQSRIEFKTACITYKVLTSGQPSYLSILLNHYTPLRTLRSANQYLLQHLWVSTEFAKRSFSYLAPKIWNNIPVNIRLCSTLPTFKHRLKTYLFKLHFSIYISLPPSSSPSDCFRLRFSMFADIVHLTNACIIIIIFLSLVRIIPREFKN